MRVIDARRLQQYRSKKQRRWHKPLLIVGASLLVLFVLANGVMALLYRDKVLPNYTVADVPVGGIPFNQLEQRVDPARIVPANIILTTPDRDLQRATADLGVTIDWPATQQNLKEARSWLPLLSLVFKRSVPAELTVNEEAFQTARKGLKDTFTKAPLPERLALDGSQFVIAAPVEGYNPQMEQLRSDLLTALAKGKTTVVVPTKVTHSTAPTGQLGAELARLQKQLEAKITLFFGSKSQQLSKQQIGRFYVSTGQSLQLSVDKTKAVITEIGKTLGVQAVNTDEAATAAHYAIQKSQPVSYVLADSNSRTYHYCTAARGVDAGLLGEFGQKLATVYGDPRGWNQGGITLLSATTGCDFTVWLSAPAHMTGFGAICDSYYSCRVGPNVVINYDRWMGATDPWNAAGGSLEDYRAMVINHETGHWFGFGHRNCTAPGQPAPVMQQQSISLQGCSFNPWPIASEITALR